MNTRHLFVSALAAGTLALGSVPQTLFAASSPPVGLPVTASVEAKCLVSGTSVVGFGAYDPVDVHSSTGINLDGTGTVSIRCTPGNGTSIALDLGANAVATQRRMAGPSSSFLNYELYQDGPRTIVWSTAGNAQTITASTNAAVRNFTVFGRVPLGQDPAATGAFGDTVQATVNF